MDAKIQELERQAIANNDEMLAYKALLERDRSNALAASNRGSTIRKLEEIYYERHDYVSIYLGYQGIRSIVRYIRIGKEWTVHRSSGYKDTTWIDDTPGFREYAMGRFHTLRKQAGEEFDRKRKEATESRIKTKLDEEKELFSKLQAIRKELGQDCLAYLRDE